MKGFFIEISNNILEPKHCKQMGGAIWLYLWLIDKITSVDSSDGKVLGGKPIKYADTINDLGVSRTKYNRWMGKLRKMGYVQTIRTPFGSSILVLKAKKRFNKKLENEENNINQKRIIGKSKTNHQSIKNESTLIQKRIISASKIDHAIKTRAVDNISDNAVDITARPPFGGTVCENDDGKQKTPTNKNGENKKLSEAEKIPKNFTSQVGEIKRFSKIEEIPEKMVGEAIALFLPIFSIQFLNPERLPFMIPATRNAIKNVLMLKTLDELSDLILKYKRGEQDRYRPIAKDIYAFCTYKFSAIESWSKKTASGSWQQTQFCTPEEARVRQQQIAEKIKRMREK